MTFGEVKTREVGIVTIGGISEGVREEGSNRCSAVSRG